ncbi:hypothetical protein GWI33_017257 [Rhynchophorus ferrugineus]|uniref:Uncharacterized protein n=1 Tax=Rhynchophorus ferrugineus TaxID=354439 RepID=A0A834HX46_RHYFE|nr:hypothetical protein GWI33_017257 [Rhynchophorus ferrugineus]
MCLKSCTDDDINAVATKNKKKQHSRTRHGKKGRKTSSNQDRTIVQLEIQSCASRAARSLDAGRQSPHTKQDGASAGSPRPVLPTQSRHRFNYSGARGNRVDDFDKKGRPFAQKARAAADIKGSARRYGFNSSHVGPSKWITSPRIGHRTVGHGKKTLSDRNLFSLDDVKAVRKQIRFFRSAITSLPRGPSKQTEAFPRSGLI